MKERKLNIELFKKVRDRIKEIPESYNQRWWVDESSEAPCGTAACLAGETIICSARSVTVGIRKLRRLDDEAQDLLGLSNEERSILFTAFPAGDIKQWPEPWATRWANALNNQRKQARVAISLLNRIIKTGKIPE